MKYRPKNCIRAFFLTVCVCLVFFLTSCSKQPVSSYTFNSQKTLIREAKNETINGIIVKITKKNLNSYILHVRTANVDKIEYVYFITKDTSSLELYNTISTIVKNGVATTIQNLDENTKEYSVIKEIKETEVKNQEFIKIDNSQQKDTEATLKQQNKQNQPLVKRTLDRKNNLISVPKNEIINLQ